MNGIAIVELLDTTQPADGKAVQGGEKLSLDNYLSVLG